MTISNLLFSSLILQSFHKEGIWAQNKHNSFAKCTELSRVTSTDNQAPKILLAQSAEYPELAIISLTILKRPSNKDKERNMA